jgi:hypothetical protein
MGDKNYRRTTGFRNWMNQRGYLPIIKNGLAYLPGKCVYQVRDDGWRRVRQGGNQ